MKIVYALFFAFVLASCSQDVKKEQSIYFEEIPMQMLMDGEVRLNAAASSGLPVSFSSGDINIASIKEDRAIFHSAGKVTIYAFQQGNDEYYEAPAIQNSLIIHDWDPNKKNQTIAFDLVSEWRLSANGTDISLKASASSGLPVKYTLSGPKAGHITNSYLYLYHGGEGPAFPDKYETTITITASQEGNDEYNPAENVERNLHVIGDVLH